MRFCWGGLPHDERIGETRQVCGKWTGGRRLAKAHQNKKCYEQTQHVVENKGHEFSEPSMSMKYNHLIQVSQHADASTRVECRFGGRDDVIFVGLNRPFATRLAAASAGERARRGGGKVGLDCGRGGPPHIKFWG